MDSELIKINAALFSMVASHQHDSKLSDEFFKNINPTNSILLDAMCRYLSLFSNGLNISGFHDEKESTFIFSSNDDLDFPKFEHLWLKIKNPEKRIAHECYLKLYLSCKKEEKIGSYYKRVNCISMRRDLATFLVCKLEESSSDCWKFPIGFFDSVKILFFKINNFISNPGIVTFEDYLSATGSCLKLIQDWKKKLEKKNNTLFSTLIKKNEAGYPKVQINNFLLIKSHIYRCALINIDFYQLLQNSKLIQTSKVKFLPTMKNVHAELTLCYELRNKNFLIKNALLHMGSSKKCCVGCRAFLSAVEKFFGCHFCITAGHGTAPFIWNSPTSCFIVNMLVAQETLEKYQSGELLKNLMCSQISSTKTSVSHDLSNETQKNEIINIEGLIDQLYCRAKSIPSFDDVPQQIVENLMNFHNTYKNCNYLVIRNGKLFFTNKFINTFFS